MTIRGIRMAKPKNEWFDWIKALLIAFALALIVKIFLVSPIIVDGPSMLPTLHDRDRMIVNKLIYRINEPKRYDIVVFHATEQKDFIKRVIGLPGEHISVKDNTLYIDDEKIEEAFLTDQDELDQILTNDFRLEMLPGEHKVIPEDYVLVLGDNRDNSTDSRALGLISIDEIVGKASVIYWPYNRVKVLKE